MREYYVWNCWPMISSKMTSFVTANKIKMEIMVKVRATVKRQGFMLHGTDVCYFWGYFATNYLTLYIFKTKFLFQFTFEKLEFCFHKNILSFDTEMPSAAPPQADVAGPPRTELEELQIRANTVTDEVSFCLLAITIQI